MSYNLINKYHFIAQWGGSRIDFLEISGLDIFVNVIPVRGGSSPQESAMKIPGLTSFPEVVLKRTIRVGDNEFFDWINTRKFGTVERRDVTISLLDENHEPAITWMIKNTFPSAYYGPVLSSTDSEVAMETLVLTHEGFTVQHNRKKN